MDNPIIYQALGILLILFFLFLMYMFTKTWRWLHVTLMFFVFGAVIYFACVAAMSYRTHVVWRSLELKNRKDAEKETKDYELLMYGDPTEVVRTTPSIRDSNAKFARMVFDRGRVWRSCTPALQGGAIVVNTTPPGGDPAETTTDQIEQKMLMYVFAEDNAPPEANVPAGTKLPAAYLGEFTVASVTPNALTLQPTLLLDPALQGLIKASIDGGATWTLYETMPVDGHNFFATDVNEKPDLTAHANDSPVFGTIDPDFAQAFLPEATRDLYLRDGKGADESDPPENVWVKVLFTEEHKLDVDSGAVLDGVEGSQTFFNQGLSEIPLLQRGEQATLKPGQIGVFPQVDAERLIAMGVCERQENVYVRTLNDYEYQFRSIYLRMVRLKQDIDGMQRNIAEITAANSQTETQIAYRTQERAKLQQDLQKFQYEAEQIGQYQTRLEQVLDVTKTELSRLYKTASLLEQALDRMNAKLTEEIDRRTREAVAEAG